MLQRRQCLCTPLLYSCLPLLSNDWNQFCPPLLPALRLFGKHDQHLQYSATVEWNPNEQCHSSSAAEQAARDLLSQIAPHHSKLDQHSVRTLQSYLLDFYHFCGDHFDQDFHFKARMVASRGASGTSCPLWHIDKVPIRWIQALAGPGCQLVKSEDGINWDAFDENLMQEEIDMSIAEDNKLRVDLGV